MARSKSSGAWLARHVSDPYVRKAGAQGYRARSAFKLIEIVNSEGLARPGETVVDLGAAPGGWSQVLAKRVGASGKVVAVDPLEVDAIPGVTFIQGDFREDEVLKRLEAALEGRKVDLVVSDMAPNISGVRATDQARSIHLCELALDFARTHLNPRGAFVVKVFQGSGYPEFLVEMKRAFVTVASKKPGASRDESREMYLWGKGLRMAGRGREGKEGS
ncbi:MAG TPA: RlmE family RNA methyltransferase [Burkholderiales bacterium]|nr:RlmE family RNA methyltransferase [Burkholderiales bacterium]